MIRLVGSWQLAINSLHNRKIGIVSLVLLHSKCLIISFLLFLSVQEVIAVNPPCDEILPVPILNMGLVTNLPEDKEVTLHTKVFDKASFDNLTNKNQLRFSFSSDVNDSLIVFNYNQVGQQNIEVWVTSPNGRQAVANIPFNVQYSDNFQMETGCDIEIMSSLTHATCETLSDGQIYFEVTGGQPDSNGFYNIKWQNFPLEFQDSVVTLSGLHAGNYCVEITDSEDCSKEFCFDLENRRTYNLIKNTQPLLCHGDSTGVIDLNVQVIGFPGLPYQFEWESANDFQQNDQTFTSAINQLKAGVYTVTVTDIDGCTVTSEEEIFEPAPISATLDMTTPIACFGGVGTFEITNISGGISPFFQYQIDDGVLKNSNSVTQLSSGDYDILIKETQTSCLWDSTFTVLEPPKLAFDSLETIPQTCKGIVDGEMRFRISGGALFPGGFYNIEIASGTFQSDKIDLTNLYTGTYSVFVTDANGCILIDDIEVGLLKKLSLDVAIDHNLCFEDDTGKILVTVITDGVSNDEPINFEWTGLPTGNTPFNNGSTSSVFGLPAGFYSLIANDVDGCSISDDFEVTEPPKINLDTLGIGDASCPQVNDGFAAVFANGGVPPYHFIWNTTPSQTGQVATQLSSGFYEVSITDNNGCESIWGINIGAGLPPEVEVVSIENESCSAPGSGSAEVAGIGGTPGYTYKWSTDPMQDDSVVTNLTSGIYEVTVTDQNNCTGSTEVEILADVLPEIVSLEDDYLLCYGDSTGRVEVVVNSNALPLTYEWSNGDTLSASENLSFGIYYVTVTDGKECKVRDSVLVDQPTQITAVIPQPILPNCFGDDTFLTVSEASGGNGAPYFFSINDASNYEIGELVSIEPNTYQITIMDSEGCVIETSITAEERPKLTLNIEAEDVYFCEEIPIKMFVSDPGRIANEGSVKWEILEGGDGTLSCTECINPIFFPGDDIAYHLMVEVVDTNGCEVNASIEFDRIQIPDLFTPNGDGANDFFEIRVCEDLQSFDNELIVFNQWGDVVYEKDNYSNDWNGSFRGKELPEAPYYFVFKIEVSERVIERKGRIAILR